MEIRHGFRKNLNISKSIALALFMSFQPQVNFYVDVVLNLQVVDIYIYSQLDFVDFNTIKVNHNFVLDNLRFIGVTYL